MASAPRPSRRSFLRAGSVLTAGAALSAVLRAQSSARPARDFDVRDFGAAGDGAVLDSPAIQRAIDAAAAYGPGARVVLRGGKTYRIGSLELRGGIDFHLADDAKAVVSSDPRDYRGGAAIVAREARGLSVTGSGSIDGRSPDFMRGYDPVNEWWRPKTFRPRLMVLTGCRDLQVRGISLLQAPSWTLHLLGCEQVLIEDLVIRNQLDVPNCDGIDPDHCRRVEIKRCRISCGDDAIVIKTTRAGAKKYGGSAGIRVSDCTFETQDSGVKIGTETVSDIRDVLFERCEIRRCSRACTIQLRDEGNVSNVEFRDIRFEAQYFSDPWWGRGEALSFTAIPRAPETKVGAISDLRVVNVTGRAENSARLCGSPRSRIRNVRFDNVHLKLDRWTRYPGEVWDNRPTTAIDGIERHGTPGFGVRYADDVRWTGCSVAWGPAVPPTFTHALEAEAATALDHRGLAGGAAHPDRDPPVMIREKGVTSVRGPTEAPAQRHSGKPGA